MPNITLPNGKKIKALPLNKNSQYKTLLVNNRPRQISLRNKIYGGLRKTP